jgi:deoxycytidine triphosphate deaminase
MIKANVGDTIRAYDFKPMAGRDDAFVEGVVEEVNCTEPGYNCFKITVTADKFHEYETEPHQENRVGRIVFVPHRVSFMEWSGRVLNLSEI